MSTSANATTSGPASQSIPISSLTAIIHPTLNALLIGHTFLTLLVPLLIALFYFSTPQSRRSPIFILNVVAIFLAFVTGVMIDAYTIHSILSIQQRWPIAMNISIGMIGNVNSILVDTILLVRLVSVHPLRHVGLSRFVALTFIPIMLKIARISNLIALTKIMAGSENIALAWATSPCLKIEWSCQVVDNAYASIAFLWTLRDKGNGHGVTSDIHPHRVSFSQRIRTLSRIALSNFLIPSAFSISQLIVIYRNVNVVIVNDIVLVNTTIAVFGVVFATVWAGNTRRREALLDASEDASSTENIVEKPRPRAFKFPGLGSWHVAGSPPQLTLGSVGYAAPTDGTAVSVGSDPEKGNKRGVTIRTESVVLGSGTLDINGDEGKAKSSGPSTSSF